MSGHRVWDSDRDHAQVSAGPVFYTYSRGAASTANIDSMVRNLADFARLSGHPLGYVLHLAPTASAPNVTDGARTTTMFNKYALRLAGVAIVVEANGFVGAALRSAVTMVFVMNRDGFKTRTFAHPAAAASWLAHLLHIDPTVITGLSESTRVLVNDHPPRLAALRT